MEIFEVGGCVRDELWGVSTKDVDFVCLAESFEAMRNEILSQGFKIHIEKPEFVTIRAGVPEGHPLRARTKDADFVLSRKDGQSSDGRRPDSVEPGTLEEDLARRDFRFNAIAKDINGNFIDPFGGIEDAHNRILRFVGKPADRISEDGLRALRGFRFIVTKNVTPDEETEKWLHSTLAVEMLSCVSTERIREELVKMFDHDFFGTLSFIETLSEEMKKALLANLELVPIMKVKVK
jgi:tRNA nucleotidyltransferase (CCA-adding enzyme)